MTQSTGNHRMARNGGLASETKPLGRLWHRLRGLLGARNGDHSLRETIEEIIEEISEEEEESTGPIGEDERVMLANILKLRHLAADDVMVPRADIVAVDTDTGLDAGRSSSLPPSPGPCSSSRLPCGSWTSCSRCA
jgi:hypothetical protein